MKVIINIIFSILFSVQLFAQIEKGKYFGCIDMCYYDTYHGRFYFNFIDKKQCEIRFEDDISVVYFKASYLVKNSTIKFRLKTRQ